MSRKAVVWVSWTVVAVFFLWVAYTVGVYSGRSYQIQKETRRDALRLYDYFERGDAKEAVRVGLLSEGQLEFVNETERDLGKVLDAKIESVSTTPLGLPVIVDLLVKREKGENREHVIRHGGDGNGLNFSGPMDPR